MTEEGEGTPIFKDYNTRLRSKRVSQLTRRNHSQEEISQRNGNVGDEFGGGADDDDDQNSNTLFRKETINGIGKSTNCGEYPDNGAMEEENVFDDDDDDDVKNSKETSTDSDSDFTIESSNNKKKKKKVTKNKKKKKNNKKKDSKESDEEDVQVNGKNSGINNKGKIRNGKLSSKGYSEQGDSSKRKRNSSEEKLSDSEKKKQRTRRNSKSSSSKGKQKSHKRKHIQENNSSGAEDKMSIETCEKEKQEDAKPHIFDPEYVEQLIKINPQKSYFPNYRSKSMIDKINRDHPLQLLKNSNSVVHPGHIYSMCISNDGKMLATASTLGSVRIFDIENWELIQELRDVSTLIVPGTESNESTLASPSNSCHTNKSNTNSSHTSVPSSSPPPPPGTDTVASELSGGINEEDNFGGSGENVDKNGYKDTNETEGDRGIIEEYYVLQFSPDDKYIVTGGKCKDRYQWDEADNDNRIMPCPLKIYDVTIPDRPVEVLNGHTEEVLCLKIAWFRSEFYYVSSSYDGSIRKWRMDSNYRTLKESIELMDGISNVVLSVEFIPNTGNKYFLGGCDNLIKLYDFENNQLLKTFNTEYGQYCDCLQFVPYIPSEQSNSQPLASNQTYPASPSSLSPQDYYFITRGVELVNESFEPATPNSCHLRKLKVPTTKGGDFEIECIQSYSHPEYISNSWLVKIKSNGRYLFAPTCNGKVFVFNLYSAQLVAVLQDHAMEEVRDLLLHPSRPLLLTCGDDTTVKVYSYADEDTVLESQKLMLNLSAISNASSLLSPAMATTKRIRKSKARTPLKVNGSESTQKSAVMDVHTAPSPSSSSSCTKELVEPSLATM